MASNIIKSFIKQALGLPSLVLAYLIRLYQVTISPDHSWVRHFFTKGYCRYHPTCSEYCRQSVLKHGVVGGFILGTARILRCNPWSGGGIDEVPPKNNTQKIEAETAQTFS
ncbi:membrane protein insertion efficiency factor YidD [Patescibacteria group bacterium]